MLVQRSLTRLGTGMDTSGRFNERDVARNAAEFLALNNDRRKRARSAYGANGAAAYTALNDPAKKRRNIGPQNVSVATAAKAAASLMRESPAYKKLVDMEEKLDLAIMRKQQDIREALKQQSPVTRRTFRLYIFNTYRSQPGNAGVTDDDVPSWSLRIQGQLLPLKSDALNRNPAVMNAPTNGAGQNIVGPHGIGIATGPQTLHPGLHSLSDVHAGNANMNPGGMGPSMSNAYGFNPMPGMEQRDTRPRCSDVFKRIVVELDDKLYTENNLIEWQRNERDQPAHGFEISRKGDKECQVRIFLDVNHTPALFKLSVPLSRLLGVKTDTRSGVFVGVWQYIKKMGLQCLNDRTAIRMDAGLKSLLAQSQMAPEVVKLHHLYDVVKSHLAPPDRLEIVYDVKLSGNVVDNQNCYDIQVNVQDPLLRESSQKSGIFGLTYPQNLEYQALKEKHVEALEKIALHKRRRDFFEGFCESPVDFINHLMLSQTRDLKVLGGSTGRNPEEERRASFYQQQWVHEAIPRYLLRKAIADSAKKTAEKSIH